ncbi:MAG: hypothetical protein ACXAEF_07165 [Candidatus Thorarchaeota archaeon]|jgi:putative sterol carrier protein
MLTEPPDFVGNILAKMLAKVLQDENLARKIKSWKMIVTLTSDYYPVSIVFNEGVSVERTIDSEPTLNVKMKFGTIIRLVEGKSSMIREMLRRRIRVEGLFRHPVATYRFYQLMQKILED